MPDYIDPTKEGLQAFAQISRTGPVQMLNLIELRATAAYSDDTQCSGAQAYRIYTDKAAPFFEGVGAEIIWRGRPEVMLIGPQDSENWDIAFIAQYPSSQAFLQMVNDPGYRAITYHRTAAVKDSRLIRLEPF